VSVVLSEHLPLLATAPDGIQKLRGLILELAVRGKLVPQDPNDEPASELLKRIVKERARLEGAGQCKKSKALPPVSEDEKPFALPHTWAWTRLGEITNFGQTDKDGEISDTTWVLDLEDIQKDTSVLLQKVRFSERQAKSDKNRFLEGDVLYGKLRPYLNKVIVADEEGVCTTEILPVRGYLGISPRYLMYAVKRPDFLAYVNAKSYGMKMPRLGTDDGRFAVFPLAPEKEQPRIVAKVDELMALCDRLEAEQADSASAHARLVETLLGTLTQSTDAAELTANWQRLAEHFDTLFTTEASVEMLKKAIVDMALQGLISRPMGQKVESKTLGTLSTVVRGSSPRPKGDPRYYDGEVPRLLIADITRDGKYVTPRIDSLTLEGAKLSRPMAKGDLVVSISGSYGLPAFLEVDACIHDGFIGFRDVSSTVNPEYLYLVLLWRKPYFDNVVKDSGLKNLTTEHLKNLVIPLPAIEEQRQIVAKVNALMALCDSLKVDLSTNLQRQTTLANTLIESALEGT
jgi:type I restriction enzyme S subunit